MSINKGMDKEAVVDIYIIEYYSAIKRTVFESVLVRWMNLEPVIRVKSVRKKQSNIVY